MATIEPVRKDVQHPQQIKRHSASLRLWHWLNTIIITGSLLTVLLNSTITDKHSTAALVKTELQDKGANVSADLSRSFTNALEDKVWAIHIYLGYGLAAMLLFRLILEIFQLADQKFIRKIRSAYVQFNTVKQNRQIARHELTVKIIYALFYILLITMVLTGLALSFEYIAFLKPFRHVIRQVHSFGMYLVLAFIIVHLAGVFIAERKEEGRGIVSDMINGGRG